MYAYAHIAVNETLTRLSSSCCLPSPAAIGALIAFADIQCSNLSIYASKSSFSSS